MTGARGTMPPETRSAAPPDSLTGSELAKLLPPLLVELLKAAPGMALAFSGGLDSRFLAHAARLLLPAPDWPRLFHVRGPHVPPGESLEALAWARSRGLKLQLVDFDPLSVAQVRANGRDRCYHCKLGMFRAIGLAAGRSRQAGDRAEPGLTKAAQAALYDGSNASDAKSFRPGLAALKELGVRSPLAGAGLDKAEIMRLAALSGLDRPRQRARPCLLTRFAYDLTPERSALAALAEAEKAVAALLEEWGDIDGAPDFRLRLVAKKTAGGDRSGMRDSEGGGMQSGAYGSLQGNGQSAGQALAAWSGELHVAAPLPAAARKALAEILEAAACGPAPVICLESVSGHFDRQSEIALNGH